MQSYLKKYKILLVLILFGSIKTYGQLSDRKIKVKSSEISNTSFNKTFKNDFKLNANIDTVKLFKEDSINNFKPVPYRFGVISKVNLTLNNSGEWKVLNNGDRIWTLLISSKKASSLNLQYDNFWIPNGAHLHIYDPNQNQILGAFTSEFNIGEKGKINKFATSLIYNDSIILEYFEPFKSKDMGVINISNITHGYRKFSKSAGYGNSGPCNVNVNCPTTNLDYSNSKNGVAKILVNGGAWCTGSLINNTSSNKEPYFLTANHCLTPGGYDAVNNPRLSNWLFEWNYESGNCTNTNLVGPTTLGAQVISNLALSDFALLKLNQNPANITNLLPYYNGWDISNSTVNSAYGIHHPSGDIKKVCIEYNTLQTTDYLSSQINNSSSHFRVVDWDLGVTEGGSSGSPLFDFNNKIVGALHGGYAQCSGSNDNGQSDWYGKLSVSWNSNTNPKRRLKDWLDPINSNLLILDGTYNQALEPVCTNNILNISNISYTGPTIYSPVTACKINVSNINITNGAKLDLSATSSTNLLNDVTVDLGSELYIH